MIAIHHRPDSFSEKWIAYCNEHNIPYKIVNCYDNDIIEQLEECDTLMWHYHHGNYQDTLFAKQLMFSVESSGKKVFPDFETAWHFDDKVAQKYLLESIGAPLVPSYVFYDKVSAQKWASKTTYPKVFKLRGGAGSSNVKLVRSLDIANQLINKAFGCGFSQFDGLNYFFNMIKKYQAGVANVKSVIKASGRIFIPTNYAKMKGREKGYIYFQEFIPGNDSDIRIIVIGDKAFAIRRMVRVNDFRASGSGKILYEKDNFNIETIRLAFAVARELKSKCCAFDFIYDENNNPLIIEISYGFTIKVYEPCVGYWSDDLNFHQGDFNPYGWMIEGLLKK